GVAFGEGGAGVVRAEGGDVYGLGHGGGAGWRRNIAPPAVTPPSLLVHAEPFGGRGLACGPVARVPPGPGRDDDEAEGGLRRPLPPDLRDLRRPVEHLREELEELRLRERLGEVAAEAGVQEPLAGARQ